MKQLLLTIECGDNALPVIDAIRTALDIPGVLEYKVMDMTDSTLTHQLASAEARDRGMAFIVDGLHVPADRVMILSVPDTVGPISNMRQAKVDAQKALSDMERFQKNVSRPLSEQQVLITGQHLRQIMGVLGMPKPEAHHDDKYIGMHSFITMVHIEAKCRELVDELKALNNGTAVAVRVDAEDAKAMINQVLSDIHRDAPKLRALRRWHMDEVGICRTTQRRQEAQGNTVTAESMGNRANLHLSFVQALNTLFGPHDNDHLGDSTEKTTPASDTPVGTAPQWYGACVSCGDRCHGIQHLCEDCIDKVVTGDTSMPAEPVVINGILVTDPDLLNPITEDAAPGVTTLCFECGQPTNGGDFCDAHAHLA